MKKADLSSKAPLAPQKVMAGEGRGGGLQVEAFLYGELVLMVACTYGMASPGVNRTPRRGCNRFRPQLKAVRGGSEIVDGSSSRWTVHHGVSLIPR